MQLPHGSFGGFTGWTRTLRSVTVEGGGIRDEVHPEIEANRRLPFLSLLEKPAVPIWCPDCQSDQIRRSRTRGTVESLLTILPIRPHRCEECDYRFFCWSIRSKSKVTRPARTTNSSSAALQRVKIF